MKTSTVYSILQFITSTEPMYNSEGSKTERNANAVILLGSFAEAVIHLAAETSIYSVHNFVLFEVFCTDLHPYCHTVIIL